MSPEAAISIDYPIERMIDRRVDVDGVEPPPPRGARRLPRGELPVQRHAGRDPALNLIMVTEQASVNGAPAGLIYHGGGIGGQTFTQPYQNTYGRNYRPARPRRPTSPAPTRSSPASADTIVLRDESLSDNNYHVSYRFNNGVPNQFTERTTPYRKSQRQPRASACSRRTSGQLRQAHAQCRASLRLSESTHSGAAPWARAAGADAQSRSARDRPRELEGPHAAPGRGLRSVRQRQDGGRASLNKYVIAQGVQGPYTATRSRPVNRLANFVTRNWTDGNKNFVPDCDLTNPLDQNFLAAGGDRCFAMSDLNFGKPTPSITVDPGGDEWLRRRGPTTGSSRPGCSARSAAGCRWTSATSAAGSATSPPRTTGRWRPRTSRRSASRRPSMSRLPGGGGNRHRPGSSMPNKIVAQDNYFTAASNYGNQIQHWNGFDLTTNVAAAPGRAASGRA